MIRTNDRGETRMMIACRLQAEIDAGLGIHPSLEGASRMLRWEYGPDLYEVPEWWLIEGGAIGQADIIEEIFLDTAGAQG